MSPHSFYIPVMGIAFTIDSPLRVAHLGIDSVISIVDDGLIERVRKYYAQHFGLEYKAIESNEEDFRARRITEYLNMVKELVEAKFDQFVQDNSLENLSKYARLLPEQSKQWLEKAEDSKDQLGNWLNRIKEKAQLGSIDVNIMTKLDKVNFRAGQALDKMYNDAHAALRGFAQSKLSSSIILSAGLNPSLFGYMQEFEDFYPKNDGTFKKKIVLKVSDYRSALIQGKYLAKNGLWVSEFRIESGLNCGGHAFATEGHLMGPILEEFRENRNELKNSLMEVYTAALQRKERSIPDIDPTFRVTAQGGIGTADEHRFMLDYYELDAVGWGSPFLLVPEATCVDETTRLQLQEAKEKDLYLSGISPLGVPFNNLRNNSKDVDKLHRIESGKPGVPCTREFLKSNTEFTDQPICTASKKYQQAKLKSLAESGLTNGALEKAQAKVTEKACICTGLGSPFMLEKNIDLGKNGPGTSVCPGPNMAYYSQQYSLQDMVDHIYGRKNVIERTDRPNVFVKELGLYIDYFKNQVEEASEELNARALKKLEKFAENLQNGISYYENLNIAGNSSFEQFGQKWKAQLNTAKNNLKSILEKIHTPA